MLACVVMCYICSLLILACISAWQRSPNIQKRPENEDLVCLFETFQIFTEVWHFPRTFSTFSRDKQQHDKLVSVLFCSICYSMFDMVNVSCRTGLKPGKTKISLDWTIPKVITVTANEKTAYKCIAVYYRNTFVIHL